MCFTVQCLADHKKLSAIFYKELGLSVSIRTCFADLSSFQKPPREEAARLGFDSFAIDCLNGPEPVLAMLCSEKKLHVAGIALRDIDEQQYSQLMDHDKIQQWATGKQFYRVNRRKELGPGAVSTMTREIQEGRWWKDEADSSAKQELQRQLDDLQSQFNELKQTSTEIKREIAENASLRQEKAKIIVGFPRWLVTHDANPDMQGDLKEQKRVLQKEHTEYKALPKKLGTCIGLARMCWSLTSIRK